MMILLSLIAIGVYAILGAVLWIAFHLPEGRQMHQLRSPGHGIPHTMRAIQHGCFAVWEWRDCRWRLISDNLPEGVEAGPPPAYPGAFDGEIVKTWAMGKAP